MKRKYCPIPWNSLSVLPDGRLRLCCHADTKHLLVDSEGHDIKLSDLASFSEFQNNDFLMKVKETFQKNTAVEACANCIAVENMGNLSPRNELKETYADSSLTEINFLDISFSNLCNMQCPMCSPVYSSVWAKKTGHTDFVNNSSMNIEFINGELFKELFSNLDMVLIQGGEPFMAKEHIPFLKRLIEIGNARNINLDYVTNNSIKVSAELRDLWKEFKHINLFISVEGSGAIYEFTRPPQKWSRFEKNMKLLEVICNDDEINIQIQFKTVLQIYNVSSLGRLLKELSRYSSFMPIIPEFSCINFPTHLLVSQIPSSLRQELVTENLDAIEGLDISGKFEGVNIKNMDGLKNILDEVRKMTPEKLDDKFWSLTNYFRLLSGTNLEEVFSSEILVALKK